EMELGELLTLLKAKDLETRTPWAYVVANLRPFLPGDVTHDELLPD
ncbi:hypothetical protein HY251_19120, partial [bacterium]|nr:hypothetical protein [bacterium]